MIEKYTAVLKRYLPEAAVHPMAEHIIQLGFHLTITRERSSKLGDFRPQPGKTRGHHISINYNLNPFAFLITMVHEMAHLTTWNRYANRVKPHGSEWKLEFQRLMQPFLNQGIFPPELEPALVAYLHNPAASSCTDTRLMKLLRLHDDEPVLHLEDLPESSLFRLKSGRMFRKGPRLRKNFRCEELPSNRWYFVHPLAEVELVGDPS